MLLDHLTDAASYPTMATPADFYTSSPVVALPHPQSNPYFANSLYTGVSSVASSEGMIFTPTGSIPATPGSIAGSKRSRGDITAPDDEDEQFEDGSVPTPAVSGKPFALSHIKRPSISSRKSQRRANDAPVDDLAQLVLPPQMREATAEPLINEVTRVLGISWTRMDATEALRINHAAYSKWIANHYTGLTEVAVWFENSAIPGYLVQARNIYTGQVGFYIFSHDLTEARLVTTESEQLLPRLKMLPALHLAAPGGHIRADTVPTVPISAAQTELSGVQAQLSNGAFHLPADLSQRSDQIQDSHASSWADGADSHETNGTCSAHSMELD